MAKIISALALVVLFSQLAQACPDLSGSFVSKVSNQRSENTMTTQNGVTVFVWGPGATPMVLDGQKHDLGPAAYQASCEGNVIRIQITAPGQNINIVLTKTATGFSMTSNDPAHSSDEYIKQ